MQEMILRRETWTATSSNEKKLGTNPATQFTFKPYQAWIINLYCSAVGRYRRVNRERRQMAWNLF